MKKTKVLSLLMLTLTVFLVACGGDDNNNNNNTPNNGNNVDGIAVVSREEGSGARSAFEELLDINTDETNMMTDAAIIQNGNGVVATFVERNEVAIGYISFATFLNSKDNLVGLAIDGVEPTTENMLSGNYGLVRPFNFVYMPDQIGIVEEAFIAFAASTDGLEILADMGAVVDMAGAEDFNPSEWDLPAGTVAFGGSTSTEATVSELMKEFMAIFPQIEITYEAVGSGAGITSAQEGTFSLGFASREIRDTELATGINVVTYCVDGIVIIVNPTNQITSLTTDQIRGIYLGEVTDWSEVH
jgi:phosphate transport system substrate-binding protein